MERAGWPCREGNGKDSPLNHISIVWDIFFLFTKNMFSISSMTEKISRERNLGKEEERNSSSSHLWRSESSHSSGAFD